MLQCYLSSRFRKCYMEVYHSPKICIEKVPEAWHDCNTSGTFSIEQKLFTTPFYFGSHPRASHFPLTRQLFSALQPQGCSHRSQPEFLVDTLRCSDCIPPSPPHKHCTYAQEQVERLLAAPPSPGRTTSAAYASVQTQAVLRSYYLLSRRLCCDSAGTPGSVARSIPWHWQSSYSLHAQVQACPGVHKAYEYYSTAAP